MPTDIISAIPELSQTNDCLSDVKQIVVMSRQIAYETLNTLILQRNWLIGKRIYEEELKGENRAEYGARVIADLSKSLTLEFGKGFGKTNLYQFYSFYKSYPNIFQTSGKSYLEWSKYALLITVLDPKAREWYENECLAERWSVRVLQRNIESQYYFRLIKPGEPIKKEDYPAVSYEESKEQFVKNPMVFEFLGIPQDAKIHEGKLESAIIDHLKESLLELGKGYAFVGRQYHVATERKDYYIDLVFYNYILNCFVLIDLKTNAPTHKDIGQMDMYRRMFDKRVKKKTDNPTLGIVLCSELDEDVVRYSILAESEQLFVSKYKLYLPSDEELRAEIERAKELYYAARVEEESDE